VIQTVDQFIADMEQKARDGLPTKAAFDAVAPVLRQGIDQHFQQRATPGGSSWPQRKDKKPHPLLEETGTLRAAATIQGAVGHVERLEGDTLTLGVDKTIDEGGLPGAAVHQYGYPPGNIPQRQYLGFSEETTDRSADVVADKLAGVA
jgi:phage gpG-like protein